jgi:hypothetical protein
MGSKASTPASVLLRCNYHAICSDQCPFPKLLFSLDLNYVPPSCLSLSNPLEKMRFIKLLVIALVALASSTFAGPVESHKEDVPCKLYTGPEAKFKNYLRFSKGGWIFENEEGFEAYSDDIKSMVKLQAGKSAKGKSVMVVVVTSIDPFTKKYKSQRKYRYEMLDGSGCITKVDTMDPQYAFTFYVEDSVKYPDSEY